MRELKYGGQIVPGDFLAISYNNHIDFGWYAGNGRGTLQYYTFRGPKSAQERYDEWLTLSDEEKKKHWLAKYHEKGLSVKCLWKSYINSIHSTRVMKITNIEDIFTEKEDREDYEKSREVLVTLNIIKQ